MEIDPLTYDWFYHQNWLHVVMHFTKEIFIDLEWLKGFYACWNAMKNSIITLTITSEAVVFEAVIFKYFEGDLGRKINNTKLNQNIFSIISLNS